MGGNSSDQPPPTEQTIVLNVLSPSTEEIPNKLTFPEIPIATTVKALKERIQDAVPARPALPRQRLIYQGKVLASDEASLKSIFGQEAINKAEPLSLHLVLSPLPGSHLHASSLPPNVRSPAPPSASQQWTPSSLPQANTPTDARQQQEPAQHGAPPHIHQAPGQTPPSFNPQAFQFAQGPVNLNQGPAPIPPHVQNAINNQLLAMSQQMTAHFAVHGQHPMQQGAHTHLQPHQFQTHHFQQPAFPQPSFQQIIAQQQQARAAAGQHGLTQYQQNNDSRGEQDGGGPSNPRALRPNSNGNTIVRENQGPNGESFRMVIQSTSTSRPNSGIGHRPPSQMSSHTPQRSMTPVSVASQTQMNGAEPGMPAGGNAMDETPISALAANSYAIFQQRLSAIESSLSQGAAPPEAVFDHVRAYLNNMASQPHMLPPGLEAPLRTRLNNLSTQAQHLRMNFNNPSIQGPTNQQANPGMSQAHPPQTIPPFFMGVNQPWLQPPLAASNFNITSQATPYAAGSPSSDQTASQNPTQTSAAPEIYLLSSPAGPHSLLLSSSGLYFTSFVNPTIPTFPQMRPPNLGQFAFSQPSPANQVPIAPTNPQAQPNPPNPPAPPAAMNAAQAQLQQQQQQNQAGDLARILIPLGGHLWLLIRLFGFVYFFTAGGGHRRAILLGICAFIVFIANTGAFRPLFRGLWEPIRRHVEGLVPLAAPEGGRQEQQPRQRRQAQQAGRNNNAVAAAQDQNENGIAPRPRTGPLRNHRSTQHAPNPSPAEVADRLLRERNEQSLFRRAERAIALFLASLVPGVGERHIAARDAAQARRVGEEREREAATTREREEREKRGMEAQDQERASGESSSAAPVAEASGNEAGGDGGGGEGMREREVQVPSEAPVEI
ncbi:MAG: hypothetical protein Q9170_001921 [Blastenia crenularia]